MAPRRRANCQICSNAESKYACPNCEVLYCSVPCYKQHSSYSCGRGCGASAPAVAVQGITPILSEDTDSENTHGRDGSRAKGKSSAVSGLGAGAVPDLLGGVSASAPPLNCASQPSRGGGLEVSDAEGNAAPDVESNSKTDSNMNIQVEDEVGGAVSSGEELILGPDGNRGQQPLRKLSSLRWPYVPEASSYPDPLTRDDPKPLSLAQYEAIARSPAIRHALSSHPRLPALLRSLDSLRRPAREESLQRALGVLPSQATFTLAGVPSSAAPYPAPTWTSHAHGSIGFGRSRGRKGEQEQGVILTDEEDTRALRALAEAVERAVRGGDATSAAAAVGPLGLDWEAMEA